MTLVSVASSGLWTESIITARVRVCACACVSACNCTKSSLTSHDEDDEVTVQKHIVSLAWCSYCVKTLAPVTQSSLRPGWHIQAFARERTCCLSATAHLLFVTGHLLFCLSPLRCWYLLSGRGLSFLFHCSSPRFPLRDPAHVFLSLWSKGLFGKCVWGYSTHVFQTFPSSPDLCGLKCWVRLAGQLFVGDSFGQKYPLNPPEASVLETVWSLCILSLTASFQY